MSLRQPLLQHWQLEQTNDVSVIQTTSLKTMSCAAVAFTQYLACAMTEAARIHTEWELFFHEVAGILLHFEQRVQLRAIVQSPRRRSSDTDASNRFAKT